MRAGPREHGAPPRPALPRRGRRNRARHRRRPRRADDARRPPAPPRARASARPDRRNGRWRPDHPRRRAQGRRVDPHGRQRRRCRAAPPRGDGAAAPAAPASAAPTRTPPPSPAPATGTPVVFPEGADEVLLPMTQMRKGIAAQMTRALAVPHAYVHMEVDASGLVRARERAKRDYQAREGISLQLRPVRHQGGRRGASALPDVQCPLDRRRGSWPSGASTWAWPSRSTTGCSCRSSATSTSSRISGLNRAIAEVADRARAGKLQLDDYGGSTFTIDNTGWFGSNLTMPIINVPGGRDPDHGGDHQATRSSARHRKATSSPSARS